MVSGNSRHSERSLILAPCWSGRTDMWPGSEIEPRRGLPTLSPRGSDCPLPSSARASDGDHLSLEPGKAASQTIAFAWRCGKDYRAIPVTLSKLGRTADDRG